MRIVLPAILINMAANSPVSIVIPCLNEEQSLPLVLSKIKQLKETFFKNRNLEIVVSDNGSTDKSVEIARNFGAKVVHCTEKGYGAALQYGIKNASFDIIVFADADNTYDFLETPNLVRLIDEGSSLVIGARLKGTIYSGAMPFLHRYVGTPVLNFFINRLHGKNGAKISDCNSGFRAFDRRAFFVWDVKSSGMEFASEMLVKALRAGSKIAEVPISLYPHEKKRIPHLKTWRDGMRHLLQILMEAPAFFDKFGLSLFSLSWLILIAALILRKPVSIGVASIFGIHTMMIALLGSFFGLTIWGIGLFLSAKKNTDVRFYNFLIQLPEDQIFWSAIVFIMISFFLLVLVFVDWAVHHFMFLSLVRETIVLSAFISNGLLIISNIITAHMIKRA